MPSGDSPGKMLRTIHKERAGEAPEPWCDESESPDETSGQPIGLSLGDPDGPSPGELLVSLSGESLGASDGQLSTPQAGTWQAVWFIQWLQQMTFHKAHNEIRMGSTFF